MFDGIVLAELGEVEAISPVGAFEEVLREVWHEEAEGRGEVEGLVDGSFEIAESDITPVTRKDAMVGLRSRV